MKPIRIPNWTYLPEYRRHRREILTIVDRVFSSGTLILGPELSRLEKQFARFIRTTYAIGVGSGTDAIFLSLKALGVGPGSEVVTVPNTAIPTVSAIVATGGTPVFVDVEEDTLLMDPTKLERAITKRTRVVLPVHLFGQACDMDGIMKVIKHCNSTRGVGRRNKIFLLEDCAQALGAESQKKMPAPSQVEGEKVGAMGDIAAFSFYPTKIVGAYGDAGMIVTRKKSLAERVRMLRSYGTRGTYYARIHGYNSRLDELQAAILSWKLKYVDTYIRKRQAIARRYDEGLRDTPLVLPSSQPEKVKPFEANRHVFHLYVVRHPRRDSLIKFLRKEGIEINIHYPYPIHLMKTYRYLGYRRGDFPVAEKAAQKVFSLPMYPELPEKDQERVIEVVKKFFS